MCVHHKSPPVLEGTQMKEMGGSSHGLIDGFNFRMALNINCLWLKEVTVYYYYGTAPAPLLLTIQYKSSFIFLQQFNRIRYGFVDFNFVHKFVG